MAEQEARALADRFWDELLELDPMLGTMVGDDRFDDRLPDPSDEGVARRESVCRAALEEAERIDSGSLDVVLRTTLDVLRSICRNEIARAALRLDRLHLVSHLWGPGQLLGELGALQRADTPERLQRYVARLREVPGYLSSVRDVVSDGARLGQVAPRVTTERVVAQVERILALTIEDSPAMVPVPVDAEEDREEVAGILRETVFPAYGGFLETLREYLPASRESIGMCGLPDGEPMYAAEMLAWTTLELDPADVHGLGVEDLMKIQEERMESAGRVGFSDPEAALAAHMASGGNSAASKDALVAMAEEQVRRGWEAAPRFFGRMPKENCEVRAVEEFREADMPFAFYQPPTHDGSRPGVYYVNGYDLPGRPLHHLATTTYHEANPGHHFQIALEQEMDDRPALRRFGGHLAGASFVEGWGLYSERLADEMGLFVDEHERLGMLDAQAHRAARLVVDTGIHAFGWSREQAIAKLEEAGVPHTDAVIETDRYIVLPGQALCYKIGQIEIENARAAAASRGGAAFALPEFHDQLLALGSLPLGALRRELAG